MLSLLFVMLLACHAHRWTRLIIHIKVVLCSGFTCFVIRCFILQRWTRPAMSLGRALLWSRSCTYRRQKCQMLTERIGGLMYNRLHRFHLMHNLHHFSVHDLRACFRSCYSTPATTRFIFYKSWRVHGTSRTHFHGRVQRLSDPRWSVFTVICGAELNETGSVVYCVSAVRIS